MFTEDAKVGSGTKHQLSSRQSFHNVAGDDQALSLSPSASSRRRPRRARPGVGPLQQHSADNSQQKNSRATLVFCSSAAAAEFFNKINAKCVLLTCASGLAWASFIVWLLGPVVPTSSDVSPDHDHLPLDQQGAFPIHSNDGVLLPGWTPLGHHSRFLGREVFPQLFERWRTEGEVVVNRMDVEPLTVDNQVLPKTDIVLAILSGNDKEAQIKRDTLRELYDKYEGVITVGGPKSKGYNKDPLDMDFRIIFVVTRSTAPPNGELVGDVLYVNVPDGYQNIVYKVKHMMGLVRHVDFKFLLKADDDTFVCVQRLADFLHDQPEESKDKIYAGVPTACYSPSNPSKKVGRVIKDPTKKWFDQKFVHHTLAGLDCYPVYMQGAFYVLSQPLVEHLHRGREHYDMFVNEDVTVGSWLLGVERTLATIHDFGSQQLWNCVCGSDFILRPAVRHEQVFFHDCKTAAELRQCSRRLVRPSLQC